MSKQPDVVWLNASPCLQWLDAPLRSLLSRSQTIQQWKYRCNEDEPSDLDSALASLCNYLESYFQPVHLIGHSTSGLLGLLYSCRYPEKVKSLTLLAVGADSAVNWQAHYYEEQRQFKSRHSILNAMAYNLFGDHSQCTVQKLEQILEQDLDSALSPHSLFKNLSLRPTALAVPLMVCGSLDDIIIEPHALRGWEPYLKSGDRLWWCIEGKHFFHFFHPGIVGSQVLDFWDYVNQSKLVCPSAIK